MLDYLPVSAEVDRDRYAAIGRALADPKRLCVLESLAIGELSVTHLSERVSRRDGTTILYRFADPRVLEVY